jgi:hypothetical protein
MKSRMNREVHVRFCERFGGETPPYLLDFFIVNNQMDLNIKSFKFKFFNNNISSANELMTY